MSDYSLTASHIKLLNRGNTGDGIAGATVTAGQVLYEDTADADKLKLADANSATATVRAVKGIALHGASAGQPLRYAKTGARVRLTTGSAVGAQGATVILSTNAGNMAPHSDDATGTYKTVIGTLDSTGKILTVAIVTSGVITP